MTAGPWPARIERLATLLDADGLAIVLAIVGGSYATYAAHDLGEVAWGAAATADLLTRTITQRSTTRTAGVRVALADGRVADTLLLTPVALTDTTAAVLAIVRVGRPFSDGDVTAATRVAALVALDLRDAHARWSASHARRLLEDRARLSREIGAAVAGERDPDTLIRRIVERVADVFGADGVSIMLTDAAGTLTVRSSTGLSEVARMARRKIGEGIAGYVAKTALPLRLTGAVKDERFSGSDPSIGEAFVVPLRSGPRTLGVLSVKYASRSGHGGDVLLRTLQDVAEDVASALALAERLRQADVDRRDAIVLYELARVALAATDERTALRDAVAVIRGALSLDTVVVWEVSRGAMRLRAAAGPVEGLPAEVAVTAEDPVRAMLDERRPRRISARSDARRPAWIPAAATEAVIAPVAGGGVSNVLVLGRSAGSFSDVHVEFAGVLGAFLASVLAGLRERREPDAPPREAVPFQRPTLVAMPRAVEPASSSPSAMVAPVAMPRVMEPVPSRLSAAASNALQEFRDHSGVDARFWATGTERQVEPAVLTAALSVVAEALRNVSEHARAGHVEVTIRYEDEQVVLAIEDDGVGFQAGGAGGQAGPRWSGLARVREATEAVGGQLLVRSEPGRGTTVRATIPLHDDEHGPYEWSSAVARDAG